MITQVCHKCKIEKPYTNEFFSYYSGKRYKPETFQKVCKECRKNIRKQYYKDHKEEEIKRDKIWRQNHLENYELYLKNYRQNHKKEKYLYQKQYEQNHKEERELYLKSYRKDHKEEEKLYHKQYRIEHEEDRKVYYHKYENNRYETDLSYKILQGLRSRIRSSLKSKNNKKLDYTINLIGCSIEKLREHIEKQFKLGMSWKNRREWHIDHIIPCSKFDLRNSEEQEICFHYTNLQPLWARDNMSKSNKIL